MPWWLELTSALLILVGALFVLLGSFSLVKMPDFYMRLHGPAKTTTLGSGAILLASSLVFTWQGQGSLHEILITMFLFITAPISAYMLAKAALHLKIARTNSLHDPQEIEK